MVASEMHHVRSLDLGSGVTPRQPTRRGATASEPLAPRFGLIPAQRLNFCSFSAVFGDAKPRFSEELELPFLVFWYSTQESPAQSCQTRARVD